VRGKKYTRGGELKQELKYNIESTCLRGDGAKNYAKSGEAVKGLSNRKKISKKGV
jgi:hypothetical protein